VRRSPARTLLIAGACSLAVYLVYFYVPISAAHTASVGDLRPLGDWRIGSAPGLSLSLGAILAGLFVLYALAYRAVRANGEGRPWTRRLVYGFAAASAILLMFLPSLLSRDVFDYMVQGRILAIHRANPFQAPAEAFAPDEFVQAMGWPQFTSLYGPAWVSAAGILAFLSPGTLAGSLLIYKILFAASHLLNGLLIGALLRGWRRPSIGAELLYLWNPLILLTVSGDAHNDAFLMMWVLLGLLFIQRGSLGFGRFEEMLGAVCLTVSILIKYVTAPFLLLHMVVALRRRGWRVAAAVAAIAAAVFVLGYLPYLRGMDPLSLLRPYQMGHYQGGSLMVASMAASRLWPSGVAGTLSATASGAMKALSLGLTILLAGWSIAVVSRARREEDLPGAGLKVLFPYLLLVTPLLRVSYGTWIVALASLLAAGPLRRAALLFSASLGALNLYWVFSIRMASSTLPLHRFQAAATLVAVGVPILYLLANLWRRRRA